MSKRVTSHDVAALAGVSRTTVSYVLNGKDQNIGVETRAKVLEAARTLGYQPDESARTLRKGVSNEIVLFGMWPFRAQFNYEFISSLQDEINKIGYNLVIYTSNYTNETDINNWINQMLARRPIGIIGTSAQISKDNLETIQKMGVRACILFGFTPTDYAPKVILPVRKAGYIVGKHLFEKGHTHIGLLVPDDPWQVTAVQDRIEGLTQAAQEANILDQFVLQKIGASGKLADTWNSIKQMLETGNPPTAIYGHNDQYSFQVMKALLEMGIRIPEDIAVVGTDNTALCEVFHPSLTSVSFDMISLARRSVEALQFQIEGKPIPPGLLDGLQPVLIPREST